MNFNFFVCFILIIFFPAGQHRTLLKAAIYLLLLHGCYKVTVQLCSFTPQVLFHEVHHSLEQGYIHIYNCENSVKKKTSLTKKVSHARDNKWPLVFRFTIFTGDETVTFQFLSS